MWRAVDSGAKARWQRKHSSQLCRDPCLLWHRGIHALGEPKNAAIGQRPITERASQGSGVKKRPLRIQPCHAEYSTAENLADDHTATLSIRIPIRALPLVPLGGSVLRGFSCRGRGFNSVAPNA